MSESTYCNAWPSGDSNTTDFWSGESWRRCGLTSPTCTPSCKADNKKQELYMPHIFFFWEQNKFAHFKQVREYTHITQLPATDQHHFLLSLCVSVHLLTKYLKKYWTNWTHFWWKPSLWPREDMIRFWEKLPLGKVSGRSLKFWPNDKR